MNAHAEREKSTLQEEYIDDHEDELLDPEQFNVGLMRHLALAQYRATSLVS